LGGGLPPCHDGVDQILNIVLIEFDDVASNDEDKGVQSTELSSDVHDHCLGVDVGFLDEDLEECNFTQILSDVIILGVDHCFFLDLWCDGGNQASVKHEVVLGHAGLGIHIGGCMGPDLLKGDLSVVSEDGSCGPCGNCCVDGTLRMFPHPHVIEWSARVKTKTLNLWASKLNGSFWSCSILQLDSIRGGVVNGSLVDQCRGQHKDKVIGILSCHVLSW